MSRKITFAKGISKYLTFAAILGFFLMVGDTYLSATAGATIGPAEAIIYGGISVASGVLLVLAAAFYLVDLRTISYAIGSVWVAAFAFNAWSNLGVAGGSRMSVIQHATLKQDARAQATKGMANEEALFDTLTGTYNTLIKERGWAAAVPMGTLEARLVSYPGLQADIWRRTNSCTDATIPASIVYCQGYATVKEDLAFAKRLEEIEKQKSATLQALESSRVRLAGMEAGITITGNQNTVQARLTAWNLAPSDAVKMAVNDGTGIAMALVLAALSAILTLAGAVPHLSEIRSDQSDPRTHETSNTDDGSIFSKGGLDLRDRIVTGFLPDIDPITGRRVQRQIQLAA